MTNFSILAALYFGSKIAKYKNLKHSKNIHHYSYFILFIFFSFFWDETALILYPLILLFFPNLILKNQRRLLLYVCLPFATAFVYFLLYPLLLDLTMQASAPLSNFVSFKEFLSLRFVHRMTNNFTLNTSLLLSDSFGLQSLKLIPHTPYPFIGIIDWLIVAVTSFFIVISIIKKRLTLDHFGKKILICILASIFLHNLFLSLSVHIWGLYWYGAYFSVFLSFLIAWLFDRLKRSKAFSCFILIPILFSLFYNFYYTNNQYKKYHYDLYHPDDLRMIFTNDVNRFHLDSTDQINTSATKKVWSNIDSYLQNQSPNDFPADLPKELGYLLIESGKFHPDSCWNAFDRWAGYYYRQGAHK